MFIIILQCVDALIKWLETLLLNANQLKVIYQNLSISNSINYILYICIVQAQVYPCNPSPCGPNSQCREVNDHAVCSCVPNFIGSPPLCRPECTTNSDCNQNEACSNQKCKDPCPGTCGIGAECHVINHRPTCNCLSGLTGNAFVHCHPIRKKNN